MGLLSYKLKKNISRIRPIDGYIVFWFIINLLFLDRFPFMHSDESWLSGLTRSMMHEGLGTTEYFFDLLPRYPHAIKTVFHVIQMPFISVFGYHLFAVRMVSLIFGALCLYAFYGLVRAYSNPLISLLTVVALSLNIQFIYGAHFARQEIIILSVMVFCLYFFIKHRERWSTKNDILMGTFIGITVGIHPSSFILALSIGMVYLYDLLVNRNIKIMNLLLLIGMVAAGAGVFVALSYWINPNFISDYLKYGDDLGATRNIITKTLEFPKFYQRLYNGVNVTYYLPNIKPYLIMFGVSSVASLVLCFTKQRDKYMLPMLFLVGINLGYLLIGRYSQPTILFIFPFGIFLTVLFFEQFKRLKYWLISGLIIITLLSSGLAIMPYLSRDYDDYVEEIQNYVPMDANVLANLNTEYAFDYGKLHDYRNLDYLDDNRMTFSDYIEANAIEYIIYPEEMDYIYTNRPVWNVLYGNVYLYYGEMNDYTARNCVYLGLAESPYAMRIVAYMNDGPWATRIYRVKTVDE